MLKIKMKLKLGLPGKNKIVFYLFLTLIITIAGAFFYSAVSVFTLSSFLKKLEVQGAKELEAKLKQERALFGEAAGRKYKAEIGAYEAMAAALEIEKQRVRELRDKAE